MKKIDLNQIDQLIKQFCSEDWRSLIEERAKKQKYKAKSVIFHEDEEVKNISIIEKGHVKIFSTYAKNTIRIHRFATDGQILGHRGLGEEYFFPVTAVALTETTVTHIPLSLFQSVLRANSLFCYYFMLFMAEELKQSEKQMKNLNVMNLRQRIAKALKINAHTFGFDPIDNKKLAYTITRTDIANFAGTTYESVIRTLSEFEKEKLVELVGKEIRILNHKKILAMVEKETGE